MWVGLFTFCFLLSAILLAWTVMLTWRLTAPAGRKSFRHRLSSWAIKGLLAPLLLWFLMNIGLSFSLQPYMPQVQAAQYRGGNWGPAFMRVLAGGGFVICSFWSAVTLGWRLFAAGAALDGDQRSSFKASCWTCFVGMLLPALGLMLLGGWGMLGLAATAMFGLMAHVGGGIVHQSKTPPMYSRAVARIKFGKYAEAEWEIIRELEKCEDDFEGWMMLAELYANQFHDLGEAQQTIAEICEHPKTKPPQFAIALHRLADWHLKLGDDPEGARRALQVICDRLPGTHLARMAQLRINQLPQTLVEWDEQRRAAPIPLPVLGGALDEESVHSDSKLERHKAAELANVCVERLERDPNEVPAREKLARLLAERLSQPEQGIEQMTLLLGMPDQPDGKRAEWLSFIAAWHLKFRRDPDTGRRMLERLIQEFPDTPQAVAARRRLQLMEHR